MRVLAGRPRPFGRRYITAIILTADKRQYEVPVLHWLTDDVWLAEVEGEVYAFRHSNKDVYTRAGGAASTTARIIVHDLAGYRPLTAHYEKLRAALEDVDVRTQRRDGPPVPSRISRVLPGRLRGGARPDVLRTLGELIEDVLPITDRATRRGVAEIVRAEWRRDEIVPPITPIHATLDGSVPLWNPAYTGQCVQAVMKTEDDDHDLENERQRRMPGWIWLVVIVGVFVGIVLAIMYDMGAFNANMGMNVGGSIPGFDTFMGGPPADPCSETALSQRYPSDGLDLRIALETGTETCPIPEYMRQAAEAWDPTTVRWEMDMRARGP